MIEDLYYFFTLKDNLFSLCCGSLNCFVSSEAITFYSHCAHFYSKITSRSYHFRRLIWMKFNFEICFLTSYVSRHY